MGRVQRVEVLADCQVMPPLGDGEDGVAADAALVQVGEDVGRSRPAQQHEPLLLTRLRGSLRDPEPKFAIIAQTLQEACRIYVAYVDRQPAACLVLSYHNANAARVVAVAVSLARWLLQRAGDSW